MTGEEWGPAPEAPSHADRLAEFYAQASPDEAAAQAHADGWRPR